MKKNRYSLQHLDKPTQDDAYAQVRTKKRKERSEWWKQIIREIKCSWLCGHNYEREKNSDYLFRTLSSPFVCTICDKRKYL